MRSSGKIFYRFAAICSFLGILFALLHRSLFFAMFDAGMGALFTRWLLEVRREERGK
jgi:hypothetical protein